jgi:hypothetical protein
MNRVDAWHMIQRRSAELGMRIKIGRTRLPHGENPRSVASVYRPVTNHRYRARNLAAQPGNGGYASSLVCARALVQKEDRSCYSP